VRRGLPAAALRGRAAPGTAHAPADAAASAAGDASGSFADAIGVEGEAGPQERARELGPDARIVLERSEPAGRGSARVYGHDPGAPRPLVLWRVEEGGRAARVALGESRDDGSLAFPVLPRPARGLRLVAAPLGRSPLGGAASAPLRVAPRRPVAPRAAPRPSDGPWRTAPPSGDGPLRVVRVVPGEAGGSVVVADAREQELGRFAVAPLPSAAQRVFELEIELGSGPDAAAELRLAQELEEGRRSEWRRLAPAGAGETEKEGEDGFR
jgi:hypothetical protein